MPEFSARCAKTGRPSARRWHSNNRKHRLLASNRGYDYDAIRKKIKAPKPPALLFYLGLQTKGQLILVDTAPAPQVAPQLTLQFVAHAALSSPTGTVKPRLREKGFAAGNCLFTQLLNNHFPWRPLIFALSGKQKANFARYGSRNGVLPSRPCAIRHRSNLMSRSCGNQSTKSAACTACNRE